MDLGLKGKQALVLGASSGLGRASAVALAAEGASVIVAARRGDRLEALRAELTAAHPGAVVTPIVCDLAEAGAAARLAEAAGAVDILVNNSGGPPPGAAAGRPLELWRAQADAMVFALIDLADQLLPGMRARGWGRVITIASSGVVQPIPGLGLSNALRGALAGWSKTLAAEVAADGVTVNMVLPGRIDTDRVAGLDAARAERDGVPVEEVRRRSLADIPAGRLGTPEEFASVVAFLASARASYVTGSMIRVDGGSVRGL